MKEVYKLPFHDNSSLCAINVAVALRKANFVNRNIGLQLVIVDTTAAPVLYTALCRSASLAFSFVLFYTLSDIWLEHLFNKRSGKRNQSVIFTSAFRQLFL